MLLLIIRLILIILLVQLLILLLILLLRLRILTLLPLPSLTTAKEDIGSLFLRPLPDAADTVFSAWPSTLGGEDHYGHVIWSEQQLGDARSGRGDEA